MQVKDIMTTSVAFCTPQTSLQHVAKLMVDYDCGGIPVIDDPDHHSPVGIITDRDIACRAVAQGKNPSETSAGECMTTPAYFVHPDDTVEDCCELMEDYQVRRVVVIDEQGRCCGMVSQADVARYAGPRQTAEVVCEVSQPG